MRRICILLTLIAVVGFNVKSQPHGDVWEVSWIPTDSDSLTAILIFKVSFDKTWNVYGADFAAAIGPLPTTVEFDASPFLQPLDASHSPNSKRNVDPSWDLWYTYFEDHAEFRQEIRMSQRKGVVKGVIRGQFFHSVSGRTRDFTHAFELPVEWDGKHLQAKK